MTEISLIKFLFKILSFASLLTIVSPQTVAPSMDNFTGPFLVWTSRDEINSRIQFNVWKIKPEGNKSENIAPFLTINITSTYYTTKVQAIVSRFNDNEIIFADWISGVFGTLELSPFKNYEPSLWQLVNGYSDFLSLNNFQPRYMQEDLANLAFVENIDYDWITGNTYWSKLDSIMVAGRNLIYYTTIYKTFRNRIHGLVLHPSKRLIFFSTYGDYDFFLTNTNSSQIVVTDMAGQNPRVLFSYPTIHFVSEIVIDFNKNRLIFTERRLTSSRIMSCKLDGSDLTIEYQKSGAAFQDLAVYQSTIFVSDMRLTSNGSYVIWKLAKTNSSSEIWEIQPIYTKLKPLGFTLYYNNTHQQAEQTLGSCSFSPPCDHICLPQNNAKRICVCGGMGYNKTNETLCLDGTENVTPLNVPSSQSLSGVIIFFIVFMCIVCIVGIGIWFYKHYHRKGVFHLNDENEFDGTDFYTFIHNLTTCHYCKHTALCQCC